ncbi:hypothetical protein K474DRAFT_1497391 [Panus rudis PR-1116 ss-1]|nr:hypothetical protein K474DRAFT_1497391 [Panus rudis PR-1116 ss-1]
MTELWMKQAKLTPEDVTSLREQLTRDIAVTEKNLHDLKVRYNATSPVYQLPPEIVYHIILSYVSIHPPEERYSTKAIQTSINVTHVCEYWRVVALNHATLWTTLYITPRLLGTDFVQSILPRSRNLPLDVIVPRERPLRYMDPFFEKDAAHFLSLKALMQAWPRIRSLDISLFNEMNAILAQLCDQDAIELKSLALSDTLLYARAGEVVPLFITKRTPNLTDLRICRSEITQAAYASFLLSSQLKSMTLDGARIDPEDLVALLRATPTLEFLALNDLEIATTLPDDSGLVELPNLRRLEIRADEADITLGYAQLIRIPPTASLSILLYRALGDVNFARVTAPLSLLFNNSMGTSAVRILDVRCNFDGLNIHGVRRVIPIDEASFDRTRYPPDFSIVIGTVEDEFPDPSRVAEVLASLPFNQVQYLSIRDFRFKKEAWLRGFRHMKEVRELDYATPLSPNFDFPFLPNALVINSDSIQDEAAIIFPKLRLLNVELQELAPESDENILELVQRLRDALHTRQRAGHKTHHRLFVRGADGAATSRLRRLVRSISWENPRAEFRTEGDYGWKPKSGLPVNLPEQDLYVDWE